MRIISLVTALGLILIFGVLLSSPIFAKETKEPKPWYYNIEYFGKIEVVFKGDAEKILKKNEITNYILLKLNNNLKGILPYKEISQDKVARYMAASTLEERTVAPKIGYMAFRIWLVGDDYPIAYYINFQVGSLKKIDFWKNEVLGYDSKNNLPQSIRKTINSMLEELAVKFLEARD